MTALAEINKVARYAAKHGLTGEIEHDRGNFFKLWLHDAYCDGAEPIGFFVTDGETFQWRDIWANCKTGTAAQLPKGANKLIKAMLPEINANRPE